ncbi:hypothetical protein AB0D91_40590 [Streptomyces canus]|uniref:hypothetical protein n=1 Tax=Streptomyces canus TaxID=58343 RepID=UPI0033F6746F
MNASSRAIAPTGSWTWRWPGSRTPGWCASTSQRTDSTHVLAVVRDLTRLELVTEAVRAALEELAHTASHLLDGLTDEE